VGLWAAVPGLPVVKLVLIHFALSVVIIIIIIIISSSNNSSSSSSVTTLLLCSVTHSAAIGVVIEIHFSMFVFRKVFLYHIFVSSLFFVLRSLQHCAM